MMNCTRQGTRCGRRLDHLIGTHLPIGWNRFRPICEVHRHDSQCPVHVDAGRLAARADRWNDRFSTRNWSSQPPVHRSRISHREVDRAREVPKFVLGANPLQCIPLVRESERRTKGKSMPVGPRVDCHFDRRGHCRMVGGQDCPRQRVRARRRLGDRHRRRAHRRLASHRLGVHLAPVSLGLRSTPQSERFCCCSLCVSSERADGEVDSRAARSNCISLMGLDDRSTSKPVKLIGF
jgi:hypothetical protein